MKKQDTDFLGLNMAVTKSARKNYGKYLAVIGLVALSMLIMDMACAKEIEVTIFRENGIQETTVLKDNESTTVPPKLKHIFKSIKDSVVFEIYWVAMEGEDIVRQTVGGII